MMEIQNRYWIIDKNTHKVFGSIRKSEFYKTKNKLRINMDLRHIV